MDQLYELTEGSTPLLVNVPHDGRYIPPDIAQRMSEAGRAIPDTDWHIARLYDFARDLSAHMMVATHSRYVVDLNRDPKDAALYPGRPNTGLAPTLTFDGTPLYRQGMEPDRAEIAARRERYWQPYHDRLASVLDNQVARHGVALLFDAHSIRSLVPRLFDGRLPDFNLGTNDGRSCDRNLSDRAQIALESSTQHLTVVNSRFTGGYITRHYGDPARSVHAMQLEMAQSAYMDESSDNAYREDLAQGVRGVLREVFDEIQNWVAERPATA